MLHNTQFPLLLSLQSNFQLLFLVLIISNITTSPIQRSTIFFAILPPRIFILSKVKKNSLKFSIPLLSSSYPVWQTCSFKTNNNLIQAIYVCFVQPIFCQSCLGHCLKHSHVFPCKLEDSTSLEFSWIQEQVARWGCTISILGVSKTWLGKAPGDLVWAHRRTCSEQQVGLQIFEGPFHLHGSGDFNLMSQHR